MQKPIMSRYSQTSSDIRTEDSLATADPATAATAPPAAPSTRSAGEPCSSTEGSDSSHEHL